MKAAKAGAFTFRPGPLSIGVTRNTWQTPWPCLQRLDWRTEGFHGGSFRPSDKHRLRWGVVQQSAARWLSLFCLATLHSGSVAKQLGALVSARRDVWKNAAVWSDSDVKHAGFGVLALPDEVAQANASELPPTGLGCVVPTTPYRALVDGVVF